MMIRPTLLAGLATVAMVSAASPLGAQIRRQSFSFDIPAQDLGSALRAFASTTRVQVIFEGAATHGKRSNALEGQHSVDEGLALLLRGTGLAFRRNDEGVLVVSRPAATVRTTDQTVPSSGEGTAAGAAAGNEGAEQQAIVVTGTNIRGAAPVGSPFRAYSRKEIVQSGVGTLDQFARIMPENFAGADPIASGAVGAGFNQNPNNGNFGAGFNLHGLGAGATLTLIDGHRIAPAGSTGEFVDISLVPLSAIDRVEVLADGASAIYGADAVAGVVNLVLRKDFQGLETSVRGSTATQGGAREFTATQLAGATWTSGSILLSYQYDHQSGLDARQRDFIPSQGGPYMILPRQERNSALAVVRQDLTPNTRVELDVLGSDRSFHQTLTTLTAGNTEHYSGSARQIAAAAELEHDWRGGWRGQVTVSGSRLNQPSLLSAPTFTTNSRFLTSVGSVTAKIDGPLFQLPGGALRVAMGAERRSESLRSDVLNTGSSTFTSNSDLSRDVSSAFGELFAPLVSDRNASPGLRQLEVSVAARYDHYSDFGSAANPKVGILWSPINGINMRGSYSRSYRAPLLTELVGTPNYFDFRFPDPSSPTKTTVTLENNSAGNPDLRPERARTTTFGFDAHPAFIPGLQTSFDYFNVIYRDKISKPPQIGGLLALYTTPGQKARLAPFIQEPPDPALVTAIFATGLVNDLSRLGPAGVQAYYDARPQNIASLTQKGFSVSIHYRHRLKFGEISAGAVVDDILSYHFQAASTVPPLSLVNQLGQPVGFRGRIWAGVARNGFTTTLSVNYWGHYENPLFTPSARIASWTTADLFASYAFGEGDGALQGLSVSLAVQNLTDARPPLITTPAGIQNFGFDTFNATPLGRVISLELRKRW